MSTKKLNNVVRSVLNCLIPIALAFAIGAVVIAALCNP